MIEGLGFFSGSMGGILGIIVVVVGVILFLKIAKEILGLAIKIAIVVVVVYILFNYTGLYYYLQGILSSFGL